MTPLLEVANLYHTYHRRSALDAVRRWQRQRVRSRFATFGARRGDETARSTAAAFATPGKTVLHGIHLRVEVGETLGIVGSSGSGKSTLAALIARLRDPTSGTIRYDGHDIAATPARRSARAAWRGDIQLVPQDGRASLNPGASAYAALDKALAARARRNRAQGLRAAGDVIALAASVGLSPARLHARPHQLSGGEAARVALARALAWRPALLILDEPTAALDVSVQAGILALLARLRREHRMSLLFISHDLDVVRLLCDKVLVMHRGAIVDSLSARRLANLMYDAQNSNRGTAETDAPLHPATRALLDAQPS